MNLNKHFYRPTQAALVVCRQLRTWALLAVMLCGIGASRAFAQTAPVTLNLKDSRLSTVFAEIEKQTNYVFAYDNSVDATAKVSINVAAVPISKVLSQLLDSHNIAYEVRNNSIVLSAKAVGNGQPRKITGRVVDAAGHPILGASIVVKGTTTGVATDAGGNFAINVPDGLRELTISYIGMAPKEISLGAQSVIQVTLDPSSIEVDQVVVTALGIKRSAKAVSYNVQTVGQDDITTVKDANFVNSLNGKVAGVTINASSSGVGGASKVVMRGSKSITQSSNALYVIDGVPLFNYSNGGETEFGSKGTSEAIADINPEDIESLSVLTGAAAAALYGSSAANGAIIVTTKRGHVGRAEVTFTSNTEMLSPFVMPSFQNSYGTGDLSSSVEVLDRSWGNKLNSANYMGYNPRQDYLQTGIVGTETVSVSRGTERSQTYFSAGALNSRGIIPNNTYDRYNFTFRNTTNLVDDKVVLDVSAGYIIQEDMNMTNQGIYMNPIVSAYLFPRGNDWNDIKMYERWDVTRADLYTQYWPTGSGGSLEMQNPYWINNRNLRSNDKERYTLSTSLNYKIADWISLVGRVRVDNTYNTYEEKLYASTSTLFTKGSNRGGYSLLESKDKQTYGDVLVNINKKICDFTIQANIGAAIEDHQYYGTDISGGLRDVMNGDDKSGIANVFIIDQLSPTKSYRHKLDWREQTQSVFGSVEVGYKGAYYLTVTGRNEWPSQLAGMLSQQSSYFYPSVGLSVVLSEIINMPKQLSYLKLRGSFASVGTPFSRNLAIPTYAWLDDENRWDNKTVYQGYMKPERTNSFEVGLTANFLRYFNVDVSYYSTKTSNQTFDPGISPGSGYSKMYVQSGDILNRGVELALGFKNTWRDFSWHSNYTFSTNHNEILSVGENVYNPITYEKLNVGDLDVGGLGQAHFILKKGGSLGDLYSRTDLERDSNGDIYVDADGNIRAIPLADGNWLSLGSVLPKANMAWSNNFNWKNFSAGFMISARLGGIVFSRTQAILDYYGVSEATGTARDNGGVWINEGRDLVDANKWYSTVAAQDAVAQYYTYSATNVRLQEASLGYTIPKEKLGGVMSITISAVARNLWMIYNKAPFDPETTASTGNYYQGIDYFMMPSMRNIGFNLKLKF